MSKRNKKKLTQHHRRPRSIGGTSDPSNISWITGAKHRAWHELFGNKTAFQIADLINEIYLDKTYIFHVDWR